MSKRGGWGVSEWGKYARERGGGREASLLTQEHFFSFSSPYPPNCNVIVVPLLQHCDKKCVKGEGGGRKKRSGRENMRRRVLYKKVLFFASFCFLPLSDDVIDCLSVRESEWHTSSSGIDTLNTRFPKCNC